MSLSGAAVEELEAPAVGGVRADTTVASSGGRMKIHEQCSDEKKKKEGNQRRRKEQKMETHNKDGDPTSGGPRSGSSSFTARSSSQSEPKSRLSRSHSLRSSHGGSQGSIASAAAPAVAVVAAVVGVSHLTADRDARIPSQRQSVAHVSHLMSSRGRGDTTRGRRGSNVTATTDRGAAESSPFIGVAPGPSPPRRWWTAVTAPFQSLFTTTAPTRGRGATAAGVNATATSVVHIGDDHNPKMEAEGARGGGGGPHVPSNTPTTAALHRSLLSIRLVVTLLCALCIFIAGAVGLGVTMAYTTTAAEAYAQDFVSAIAESGRRRVLTFAERPLARVQAYQDLVAHGIARVPFSFADCPLAAGSDTSGSNTNNNNTVLMSVDNLCSNFNGNNSNSSNSGTTTRQTCSAATSATPRSDTLRRWREQFYYSLKESVWTSSHIMALEDRSLVYCVMANASMVHCGNRDGTRPFPVVINESITEETYLFDAGTGAPFPLLTTSTNYTPFPRNFYLNHSVFSFGYAEYLSRFMTPTYKTPVIAVAGPLHAPTETLNPAGLAAADAAHKACITSAYNTTTASTPANAADYCVRPLISFCTGYLAPMSSTAVGGGSAGDSSTLPPSWSTLGPSTRNSQFNMSTFLFNLDRARMLNVSNTTLHTATFLSSTLPLASTVRSAAMVHTVYDHESMPSSSASANSNTAARQAIHTISFAGPCPPPPPPPQLAVASNSTNSTNMTNTSSPFYPSNSTAMFVELLFNNTPRVMTEYSLQQVLRFTPPPPTSASAMDAADQGRVIVNFTHFRNVTLVGMVTQFVRIDDLSLFLHELPRTRNAVALLVDNDDFVLGTSAENVDFSLYFATALEFNSSKVRFNANPLGKRFIDNCKSAGATYCAFPVEMLDALPAFRELKEEAPALFASGAAKAVHVRLPSGPYFAAVRAIHVEDHPFIGHNNNTFNWRVVTVIPEDDILGEIKKGRDLALSLVGAMILVAMVLAFAATWTLLRPLQRVAMRMYLTATFQPQSDDSEDDDDFLSSSDRLDGVNTSQSGSISAAAKPSTAGVVRRRRVRQFSMLSEVATIQRAFALLNGQVRRARHFLPAALLIPQEDSVSAAEEEEEEELGTLTEEDDHQRGGQAGLGWMRAAGHPPYEEGDGDDDEGSLGRRGGGGSSECDDAGWSGSDGNLSPTGQCSLSPVSPTAGGGFGLSAFGLPPPSPEERSVARERDAAGQETAAAAASPQHATSRRATIPSARRPSDPTNANVEANNKNNLPWPDPLEARLAVRRGIDNSTTALRAKATAAPVSSLLRSDLGLVRRRATVLYVNIGGFNARVAAVHGNSHAASSSGTGAGHIRAGVSPRPHLAASDAATPATFVTDFARVVDLAGRIADRHRGLLDSFHGDRLVLTFNAARACGSHAGAAATAAIELLSAEHEPLSPAVAAAPSSTARRLSHHHHAIAMKAPPAHIQTTADTKKHKDVHGCGCWFCEQAVTAGNEAVFPFQPNVAAGPLRLSLTKPTNLAQTKREKDDSGASSSLPWGTIRSSLTGLPPNGGTPNTLADVLPGHVDGSATPHGDSDSGDSDQGSHRPLNIPLIAPMTTFGTRNAGGDQSHNGTPRQCGLGLVTAAQQAPSRHHSGTGPCFGASGGSPGVSITATPAGSAWLAQQSSRSMLAHFTCGIASGPLFVGALGSRNAARRFHTVGAAFTKATVLERLCRLFGVPILMADAAAFDAELAVHVLMLDGIDCSGLIGMATTGGTGIGGPHSSHYPTPTTDTGDASATTFTTGAVGGSSPRRRIPVMTLSTPTAIRASPSTEDEWMYEMGDLLARPGDHRAWSQQHQHPHQQQQHRSGTSTAAPTGTFLTRGKGGSSKQLPQRHSGGSASVPPMGADNDDTSLGNDPWGRSRTPPSPFSPTESQQQQQNVAAIVGASKYRDARSILNDAVLAFLRGYVTLSRALLSRYFHTVYQRDQYSSVVLSQEYPREASYGAKYGRAASGVEGGDVAGGVGGSHPHLSHIEGDAAAATPIGPVCPVHGMVGHPIVAAAVPRTTHTTTPLASSSPPAAPQSAMKRPEEALRPYAGAEPTNIPSPQGLSAATGRIEVASGRRINIDPCRVPDSPSPHPIQSPPLPAATTTTTGTNTAAAPACCPTAVTGLDVDAPPGWTFPPVLSHNPQPLMAGAMTAAPHPTPLCSEDDTNPLSHMIDLLPTSVMEGTGATSGGHPFAEASTPTGAGNTFHHQPVRVRARAGGGAPAMMGGGGYTVAADSQSFNAWSQHTHPAAAGASTVTAGSSSVTGTSETIAGEPVSFVDSVSNNTATTSPRHLPPAQLGGQHPQLPAPQGRTHHISLPVIIRAMDANPNPSTGTTPAANVADAAGTSTSSVSKMVPPSHLNTTTDTAMTASSSYGPPPQAPHTSTGNSSSPPPANGCHSGNGAVPVMVPSNRTTIVAAVPAAASASLLHDNTNLLMSGDVNGNGDHNETVFVATCDDVLTPIHEDLPAAPAAAGTAGMQQHPQQAAPLIFSDSMTLLSASQTVELAQYRSGIAATATAHPWQAQTHPTNPLRSSHANVSPSNPTMTTGGPVCEGDAVVSARINASQPPQARLDGCLCHLLQSESLGAFLNSASPVYSLHTQGGRDASSSTHRSGTVGGAGILRGGVDAATSAAAAATLPAGPLPAISQRGPTTTTTREKNKTRPPPNEGHSNPSQCRAADLAAAVALRLALALEQALAPTNSVSMNTNTMFGAGHFNATPPCEPRTPRQASFESACAWQPHTAPPQHTSHLQPHTLQSALDAAVANVMLLRPVPSAARTSGGGGTDSPPSTGTPLRGQHFPLQSGRPLAPSFSTMAGSPAAAFGGLHSMLGVDLTAFLLICLRGAMVGSGFATGLARS